MAELQFRNIIEQAFQAEKQTLFSKMKKPRIYCKYKAFTKWLSCSNSTIPGPFYN
jgi:hypothetical protein